MVDLKQKDTMKLFLQKQPYNMTMAKHTLGIHQMRLIVRAIEFLQPFMSCNINHTQNHDDIWAKIKVSELVVGNNVKPLREALEGIMRKIVRIVHYIPKKGTYLEIGTPIVKEYKYEHGSSFVELQISGHLLPKLIDLAHGYTKYSLDVAFKTSSPNVFKLYQYIAHFRDKRQIQCNVETLRKWLKIEDKYNKPAHIKQRILEPAMRELKEKADVWFDIAERIKDGRRMIGWKFNIYTKKEPKKLPKPTKANAEAPAKKLSATEKRLQEEFHLSPKQSAKVAKAVKKEDLTKAMYDMKLVIMNDKVMNIGGYAATFLSKRFDIKL